MSYQSLDSFEKSWAFKRQDPFIAKEDLQAIKPLNVSSANQIWHDYISHNQLHPDHFTDEDWPKKKEAQLGLGEWEDCWDSDITLLPETVAQHLSKWQTETTVYFCYHSDQVIETTFAVFQRSWKNFLFFDNGPLLIGRRKKQAVQFFSNGHYHLLQRL